MILASHILSLKVLEAFRESLNKMSLIDVISILSLGRVSATDNSEPSVVLSPLASFRFLSLNIDQCSLTP